MPIKGNAAVRYTPTGGQETTLYLAAPLYVQSVGRVKSRFTEESLDRRTVNVIVIDGGAEEMTARLRFQGDPGALMDMLDAAADGAVLSYYPDARLAESYPLRLIDAGEVVRADVDPDRFAYAEYTVTLRLRRVDGGSLQALVDNVVARYAPGRSLARVTFSRASTATYRDRAGIVQTAAAGALRDDAWLYESHTGLYRRCTLLEGARTNVLWDSSNFAAGSAWTGWVGTLEPAASLINGQAAYKHINDGMGSSRNRAQTRGVFTGQPETFYAIVENVDATETAWGIRDTTANDWVALATFTWGTETAVVTSSGVGTAEAVRVRQLADTGPNGGPVWLLAVTATPANAGNARSLFIYPSGTGTNTKSAILHHAQHEEAHVPSSPIVTTASAGATRAADGFAQPFGHAPQEMTVYVRFTELGTAFGAGASTFAHLWGIGDGDAATPNIGVRSAPGFDGYGIFRNGVTGLIMDPPSYGDTVEMLLTLSSAGLATLAQYVNGTLTGTSVNGPAALPASWGTDPRLYVGSAGTTRHGLMGLRSYGVSPGTLTLAQCRERFPEPAGVAA